MAVASEVARPYPLFSPLHVSSVTVCFSFYSYVLCVRLHFVLGIIFFLKGDISSSEVSVVRPLNRYKHTTKQSAKAHRQRKPRSSTSGTKAQVSCASFASTLLRCRYTRVSPSPRMLPGTAPAVAVRVPFFSSARLNAWQMNAVVGLVVCSYDQTHLFCAQAGCTSEVVSVFRQRGRVALQHVAVALSLVYISTTVTAYCFHLTEPRDGSPKCIRIIQFSIKTR